MAAGVQTRRVPIRQSGPRWPSLRRHAPGWGSSCRSAVAEGVGGTLMCGWIKERILGAVSAPRRAQCRSATIIVLLYTPPRKKKLRGRVEGPIPYPFHTHPILKKRYYPEYDNNTFIKS
eukprot:scaffold9235_cov112-Isochrysis_galbana.AAC.2